MARAFSAKDAKQLIRQHQKLRNQLIDNYNYAERQKKDSNSIASSLFSRNVFAKLLEDELLSGNIRSLDSQDVQRLLCSLNKYIKGKSLSEDSETLARDTRIKYNQEINNLQGCGGSCLCVSAKGSRWHLCVAGSVGRKGY